jgi:hypothetical protein
MLLGGEGYEISRSVRLRSSASAYFNRMLTTPTDNKKWTFSVWGKRGNLGSLNSIFGTQDDATASGNWASIRFNAANQLEVFQIQSGAYGFQLVTTRVFRDPSAFYNISVLYDSTDATASNRIKVYVNGEQVTAFATASYPILNALTYINQARLHYIGAYSSAPSSIFYTFDGYLTEVNFIDGQALTPSSFGETDSITGVWKAKKYAGTYGTNGFFLNFSDNSNNTAATIGKDSSGNGNNWTPNNISVTAGATYDSMLDVPTMWADGGNGRGNYAVLSPTVAPSGRTTLSAANLQTLGTSSSESGVEYGTIQASSGKWYWECTVLALSTSATYPAFGVGRTLINNSNGDAPAFESGGAAIFTGGAVYKESSLVTTVSSYTTNDVIGIALDVDNLTCAFYKNGTLLTTVTSLTAGTYFATIGSYYNSSAAINFGQRPFAYTPPTGFKALNTQNLPDATIKKGNAYFDASLFAPTSGVSGSVTGVNFQPDFVWSKNRGAAESHTLIDAVRGGGNLLQSNTTNAEQSGSFITSFNSNGFSYGTGIFVTGNYVGWQWKESASAGFDIVTYTGTGSARTISHSLGVAPKMIIIKDRTSGSNFWVVGHTSITWNSYLRLNDTTSIETSIVAWNNTAPTSSVFSLGTSNVLNASSNNYIAYLFAEVAGFSKFGSYTGNGSTDGPFVYLGFRPRFVMVKLTSSAGGNWVIMDSARPTYNKGNSDLLYPNLSNAEASSGSGVEMLSNGFKLNGTYGDVNASGLTYIYAAFAENPFKNSLAR